MRSLKVQTWCCSSSMNPWGDCPGKGPHSRAGVTQPKPSASGFVSGVQPSGRQHIYLRASITGSTCELMPRSVNKNVIHGLRPSHNFRF